MHSLKVADHVQQTLYVFFSLAHTLIQRHEGVVNRKQS